MLGLLFIYFIGKYYYALAVRHGKSKWGFGVLGVATYYAGSVVFLVPLFIIGNLFIPDIVTDIPDAGIGLVGLPFGILSTVLLYNFLKKKWEREALKLETIEEIGISEEI